MLRRFILRYQPELVVSVLGLVWILAGIAIHGCGGGGGGKPTQPPTEQSIRSVAETTAKSVRFANILRQRLSRSRQIGCPMLTWQVGSQTLSITADYGNGCIDQVLVPGHFFKGRVNLTVYNPQIDMFGNLVGFSRLTYTFNNLGDMWETYNGNFSLTATTNPLVWGLDYDIRYNNIAGCNEREVFNGYAVFTDVTFSAFTLTGLGSYNGPSGNFKLEMTDLLWDLTTDCEYPEGGILKVTVGNMTATITFSGVCGRATVAINGSTPSVVLLPALDKDDPTDPCF